MPVPANRPSTRERIEEIFREIGVLLVTFAPLDAAFAADLRRAVPTVLIIVAIGIGFIAGSRVSERGRWIMIWDERTTFFAVYYGSVLVIGLVAMQLAYVFEKRAQRKHDGEAAK